MVLKAAREKVNDTYKGKITKFTNNFFNRTFLK